MKFSHWIIVGAAAAALVGCGDEEETQEQPNNNATVNEQAAQSAATSAYSAVQAAIDTGEGQAAAFQLASVGASAFSIVTPSSGQQPMGTGQATQSVGEGTCECTANSCTFDDCGDASGFAFTGTISWTDGSLDCDYTVAGIVQGNTYNFGIFCDLDYTTTSLDGRLDTDGDLQIDANGTAVTTAWDVDMTFHDVTYPGPAGGSLDVTASTTVNGQSFSASGSVTF